VNPNEPAATEFEDPRVVAALEEYLAALEAGQRPHRQAFLARHADVAEALAECLDGVEVLHQAASAPQQPVAEVAGEWQPGTALGDFRILREVGRGGMGVVYEAEQVSLGRRIALKILPFALTLDPRQLQRFKNEARAAAHLHHTNIVPIYSVGCERSVHFYAMQFIEGQSLAEVIRGMRRQAGPKVPGGTDTARTPATAHSGSGPDYFRSVARWVVQAAEALEHAHRYGVVHRDIKPSNLLVDGAGQLWVTDFGLAQFQSDAALTLTGDLLGTLRYMSPEQALAKRGVVDHRSDVYSLGATLYELLTLEPAFGGRDRQELLRQIAFEEPLPPRRRNPAIPVDLDTIVGKAMAKAVEERYATAQELADDIRRYLEHRPIRARRPTPWQRAAKWSRRHRAVVMTALAALVVAAVGFATSTALIARAFEETKTAYVGEAEQRRRAEENFREARRAIDIFAKFSEEELNDHPLLQDVRRRLLESALDYYQEFLEKHAEDPSIKADLTASRARVSQILKELSTLQGTTLLAMLQDPLAQDSLGLDAGQKQQAAQLARRFSEQWGVDYRPPPKRGPGDRQPPSPESTRAVEKAITELLRPGQNRRFRQIALQVQQQGLYGFSDPGVVEALGLTSKQREQIRKLQRESHRSCEDHVFKGGKKRGVPASFWVEVQEKILNVLTPEQRARLQEMTGEPIRLDIHYGYPFDGRDPRPSKRGPHHG
jgi:hypothetical protein